MKNKKATLLISIVSIFGFGTTYAKTMSCVVNALTAEDFISENYNEQKTSKIVQVKINKDFENTTEFQLNGSEFILELNKVGETAGLYEMHMFNKITPQEQAASGPVHFSAHIYDNGQARENGFTVDYKNKDSRQYSYLQYSGGVAKLTPKAVDALKKNNMWGKHPLNSSIMSSAYLSSVAESIPKLIKKGQLKNTDLVSFSTVFDCTLNP